MNAALSSIVGLAWVYFFVNVGRAWSFPWDCILIFLSSGALIGTVRLVQADGKGKMVPPLTRSTLITVMGTWTVFLWWINPHLSLYWSLLVPLLAILIACGIAMLRPEPKREEKPEELLTREDPEKGA